MTPRKCSWTSWLKASLVKNNTLGLALLTSLPCHALVSGFGARPCLLSSSENVVSACLWAVTLPLPDLTATLHRTQSWLSAHP